MKRYSPFFEQILEEAIIRPEEYFEPIEKICRTLYTKHHSEDNIVKLCKKLSSSLNKFKIKFIPNISVSSAKDFYIPFGINTANVMFDKYCTIVVHCNMYVTDAFANEGKFNNFIKSLYTIIKHELIHRQQFLNIESQKVVRSMADKKPIGRSDVDYVSDKQEIMAFAWQAIEYFRIMGLSKETIISILREPPKNRFTGNSVYDAYLRGFKIAALSEETIKLFYKYAYLYAQEV